MVTLYELKDHERVAGPKTSRGLIDTGWHGALRDLSALPRHLMAELRCDHGPECATREKVKDFVAEGISRRRRRAATVALGHSDLMITEYGSSRR